MKKILVVLICCCVAPAITYAQDTITQKERWKQQKDFLIPGRPWTVELPLWIPGFAGSFAYGDVSVEGEDGVNPENPIEPPPGGEFGKIFSRLFTKNWYLKFFYMTKMSYENKGLLIQLDGIIGEVGNSVKFNYNNTEIVQANFQTFNLRLLAGYKIVDKRARNEKFRFELYGYLGSRVHFQRIYSNLNDAINKLDINPVWAEPVYGIQTQFSWKKWFFVVQGDYGGFFINSKSSFQLTTYLYYRTGRFNSIKFGWNHLDINHQGNFLNEDYQINITLSGPSVGFVLLF